MVYFSIFLIAVGLSFDTFAVSVTSGLLKKEISFINATKIAFFLALFQSLMPLIGWLVGSDIKDYIKYLNHWIAFIVLAFIGIKMIWESNRPSKKNLFSNPLKFRYIISISFATSIDALFVGFSFACLNYPIFYSVVIIGFVTFIISMLGILAGKKTGELFGKKMEIAGGIILILIGLKILVEQL